MAKRTSLGKKFNILLIAVFVVGTILTWALASWITRRQTEQEIAEKAQLLLKATAGVRAYTNGNVSKLLLPVQDDKNIFLPETVPAFSARTVFEKFRSDGFEDFFYKEAGSNPTNVRDNKADVFEEQVLQALRDNEKLATLSGYREDFGGQRRYFTAQAMRLTDANCLRCHSTPDKAPPEMVKIYGDKSGYNWQLNDVIAARFVYVPAGKVSAASQKNAFFVTSLFVLLFGTVVGAINLLLRKGVLTPLHSLTQAAHAISKSPDDDAALKDFATTDAGKSLQSTQSRQDELGDLAEGFLTMAGDVQKRELGLRQARSQAQQREAYFRALIENASVTYLILDTRYMIRYASPLVKKVLGADPNDLTGKLFLHIVPDDNQRPLFEAVERAESKKGTSDPFIFKRILPGPPPAETRYIEATVTNLIDQPSIKGLVIVLRDVTERHQLEELKQGTQTFNPITASAPAPAPQPALAASPVAPAPLRVPAPEPEPVKAVVESPDPLTLTSRLVESFPALTPTQQQAIILRLVAAGLTTAQAQDTTARGALPMNSITTLRSKFQLPDTESIDPARVVELFALLADYAVALDTLVWSTWKQLAPNSDIKRTGSGSSVALSPVATGGIKKLFAAYIGAESTIPRGQAAYDLERSRALIAALIASIGQVGQEFAKRYRAKFEPVEIEKRAGVNGGGGLLGSKDAKCWRAYRELANEMDAAKIEADVLQGLSQYAESLMKSLR